MYKIENVTDCYFYAHEYENIQSAVDDIVEYEREDIAENDMIDEYIIVDENNTTVYNSLDDAFEFMCNKFNLC